MNYVLLGISILLGAAGQVGLKYAATIKEPKISIISTVVNEYLALSLFIYFVSVILYTLSLREIALSVAFPSVALSYVLVSYLSSVIWRTNFGARELLALLLILIAISMLATSN